MKTQIAELVTGDFEENTLTLEVDGEMTLKAGKYAIVPFDEYQKLVNEETKEAEKALAIQGVMPSSYKYLVEYLDYDGTKTYVVIKAENEEQALEVFNNDYGNLEVVELNMVTYN